MTKISNAQVRLLLVDDTPANLEIAGTILEKEGYDLYIADSGDSALELASKTAFDLILLDIMMPGLDGFETLRKLRQLKQGKHIPVIFLSAKMDIESVVRGFELGAVDYIRKPFNLLELKARVQTHVELKKTRELLEEKNKSLRQAYKDLAITAATDPLTRLLNRREMMKRMECELAKHERAGRPFSVIIADIDDFKKVNDTYGHLVGDNVLVAVAAILLSGTRRADSVARWGGEEFLLMLPETPVAGAAQLAEKLRQAVERHVFAVGPADVRVTMSFGACEIDGADALDDLLTKADLALYRGKAGGRNRVIIA